MDIHEMSINYECILHSRCAFAFFTVPWQIEDNCVQCTWVNVIIENNQWDLTHDTQFNKQSVISSFNYRKMHSTKKNVKIYISIGYLSTFISLVSLFGFIIDLIIKTISTTLYNRMLIHSNERTEFPTNRCGLCLNTLWAEWIHLSRYWKMLSKK